MMLRDMKHTLLVLKFPAAAAKSFLSVAGTVSLQHLHKEASLLFFYLCSARRFRLEAASWLHGR